MFVGGLNKDTTETDFFEYFEKFGKLIDKTIVKDFVTKHSRGFGFLTYETSECVEDVFKAGYHILDGKTLDVKRAMPREFVTPGAHSKTKKLFIGGFKYVNLQPEELREYIESRHPTDYGKLTVIDFMKDKEGVNKGFGFLECTDSNFADRLAISENSFKLKGRIMSIQKAEPQGTLRVVGENLFLFSIFNKWHWRYPALNSKKKFHFTLDFFICRLYVAKYVYLP